jgi:hypothetical protein
MTRRAALRPAISLYTGSEPSITRSAIETISTRTPSGAGIRSRRPGQIAERLRNAPRCDGGESS